LQALPFLQGLSVEEAPFGRDLDNPEQQCKRCVIHLQFHKLSEYPEEVGLQWQELVDTVEGPFASGVDAAIQKCFRKAAFTAGIERLAVSEEGKGKLAGTNGHADMYPTQDRQQAAHSVADINDAGEKEEDENQEVSVSSIMSSCATLKHVCAQVLLDSCKHLVIINLCTGITCPVSALLTWDALGVTASRRCNVGWMGRAIFFGYRHLQSI
jgi:hypothetical protein